MKASPLLALVARRSVRQCLLFFLLSAVTSQAQTYIFGRADFAVGTGPASVATGDFNGDGIPDLVSVNQFDNTVSILLGNMDGTFNPQVPYPTGPGPTAVVTGDFNGDGNLDLAVTNANCVYGKGGLDCGPGTVSILLGNGDGSFQPHFDYATGIDPISLAAGDLNGDSKLDLAITNAVDSTVSVLVGNGDGTFKAQVVYATAMQNFIESSGPRSEQLLVMADFNNDHKLDLAVACANVVDIFLGNGDGTFQNPINSGSGGIGIATGDFNRDGNLDLVVEDTFLRETDILLGRGDGTFVLNATYPLGESVSVADLNGDGKPDLAITALAPRAVGVAILLGNGDGTFQSAVQYGVGGFTGDLEGALLDLIIADLNGDGKPDLVIANVAQSGPGSVSVLLGFGDGTFVGGTNYPAASGGGVVISADFNGDGKPDLATTYNPISVLLGNGDGTFQPAINTTTNAGGFTAGDLNGDGKADLVGVFSNCSTTCLPGDAVVLIGNGDGTFKPPVEYTVGLQPESVAVGDFNGDGKPDLAISNYAASTVSILAGNGDGTFQPHIDYPVGASPGTIVTGDFNGDGRLDLATVNYSGTGVSVLLGNGDGTFQKYYTVSVTLSGIYWLATGDFNGDGKLDLAVTTETSGQLFILLGNGDGTFQTPILNSDGLNFGLPSVADFNGDGKLDLIVGGGYYYVAAILLGNGDGTFQPPIFNFLSTGLFAVADFNQDGSPDVAGSLIYEGAPAAVSVMLSVAFKGASPASLNFGSQGVGTTGTPQTITISNPSNVSLNIASIAASGNFSQTNNCGASLPSGDHCAVNVTFTPTATGLQSGAITVTDNTKISPLAIPLSGTGVNGPFLTPVPSRVNFASQSLGTSSNPAVIMFVNSGNALLNISSIGITGTNASDFSLKNACGSSLAPGASCSVKVTFTPTASGSRTAGVSISDTAPGSPQSVSLTGTGLGPVANLSLYQLTFGSQAVGTMSAAQAVTLMNTGSSPLDITSIAASGDFAETNTCNTSLVPGGKCQISVTFTPSAAGSRTGDVTVTDNAVGSPQAVALSGTGTAAAGFSIGEASGSSNSATITPGQTASFDLAVTPTGSFAGTVSLSCTIAPAVTSEPICTVPASVNVTPGTAASAMVKISSTAAGTAGSISQANLPNGIAPTTTALLLLASGLLFVVFRRRGAGLAIPIIAVLFLGVAGCGGGSSPTTSMSGTPAGTYTATITAKSGSLSHNTALTLIVQ
jgi:hypothetical protein